MTPASRIRIELGRPQSGRRAGQALSLACVNSHLFDVSYGDEHSVVVVNEKQSS
jgi:hypothetical protein